LFLPGPRRSRLSLLSMTLGIFRNTATISRRSGSRPNLLQHPTASQLECHWQGCAVFDYPDPVNRPIGIIDLRSGFEVSCSFFNERICSHDFDTSRHSIPVICTGQFVGQRYVALETYRRNGEGVKTPVWFVEHGGKLYVWTVASSWKARRIRNNPKVRIAPCSARGQLKGSWIEGKAKANLAETEANVQVVQMLREKYGLQFWLLSHLHGRGRVIIEIEPRPS